MLHDINTLIMNGKTDGFSREIETIKKNETEILQLKNTTSEI